MPKKNIAPGTNHIKVPLPQGERKVFCLMTVKSDDFDTIERVAKECEMEIHEVISQMIEDSKID